MGLYPITGGTGLFADATVPVTMTVPFNADVTADQVFDGTIAF